MIKKNEIIFLISQPRSGSTLLQQLLGHHSQIYTCPEPWLLLPPLYMLKNEGIYALYDESSARKAQKDFFCQFPEGEKRYVNEIALTYERLYGECARLHGKSAFLDKTPRYYLILDLLLECFPAAAFLVLVRNPLAVVSSVIDSFYNGDIVRLFYNDRQFIDIIEAPHLLTEALNKWPDRCLKVQYETLVSDAERTLRNVCAHIGIGFERNMLTYQPKEGDKGKCGDQKNIYKHRAPTKEYIDKWKQRTVSSMMTGFLDAYWDYLGAETLATLGYSFKEGKAHIMELRHRCGNNKRNDRDYRLGRKQFIYYAAGIPHEINTIGKIIGVEQAHGLFKREGFASLGKGGERIVARIKRYIKGFIERGAYDLCHEWLKQIYSIRDIGTRAIASLYDHAIMLAGDDRPDVRNRLRSDLLTILRRSGDSSMQKQFEIAHRLFLFKRYKESVRYFTAYLTAAKKKKVQPFDFLKACECMVNMSRQGYCYNEDQYINRAITFINNFKKKTPCLQYALASFLQRSNQYKKAYDLFNKLISEVSDQELKGKAHYHLGEIAAACGDEKRAQQEYSFAVQLCPGHDQARAKTVCQGKKAKTINAGENNRG